MTALQSVPICEAIHLINLQGASYKQYTMRSASRQQLVCALGLALLAGQASAGFFDAINNAANTVNNALTNAATTATDAVTSGLGTATDAVGSAGKTAANAVTSGLNTADNAVNGALNTANRTVTGALKTAQNETAMAINKGVNVTALFVEDVKVVGADQFQNFKNALAPAAADFRNAINFDAQLDSAERALAPAFNLILQALVYTQAVGRTAANEVRNASDTLENNILRAIRDSRAGEVSQAVVVTLNNDTSGLAPVPDQNLTQALGFTVASSIAQADNATITALNTTRVAATFVNGFSDTITPCAATVSHTPGETTQDFQRKVAAKCCYLVTDSLTNAAILTESQGVGDQFLNAVMNAPTSGNATVIPLDSCFKGVSVS
ncbi:hypothetical protein WJX72_004665 [[Myrmecia] bisecta]|uniref:Uncharacterized protein n=1 Tax=[Myrmecia] bisecta TaxID=41462 RepID=A0AAW1PW43_9CHLO